jgi:TonB family protein
MTNHLFTKCLCVSAAAHALIFIALPHRMLTFAATQTPIEVTYIQSFGPQEKARDISSEPPPQDAARIQKNAFENRKTFMQDFLKAEIFRSENKREAADPAPVKKKSVQMPDIPGQVFQSQEYKDYYQIVREEIRRQAYRNYKRLQIGKVLLNFTLSAAGELKEVRIDENSSTNDEYLRAIALESVKESSPFPEFPRKLRDNKQLDFNVIIFFELK